MTEPRSFPIADVLSEVLDERIRQNAKWGEQNHPDGTRRNGDEDHWAAYFKNQTDQAATDGAVTWRDILNEECAEAYAETDPAKLRAELIQVAAVCVQWVQAIDRREARS